MKTITSLCLLVSCAFGPATVVADEMKEKSATAHEGMAAHHVALTPDELKWGEAPPAFNAGAQIAVLVGNPLEKGPYTVRLKMPDGYKISPHTHPTTENVTVISGTFYIGMGEKFDEAAGKELPAGGLASMPARMAHFAWAKGETIVQVHGMGPFRIDYVNPQDDPRKAKK